MHNDDPERNHGHDHSEHNHQHLSRREILMGLVSGHGSVQEGKSVLRFFRSYIDELNEAVSRGVERGTTLAEVQKSLVPERLRSLAADQVTRLGREVEALAGPATNPAERLKGSVAANVADVYNYYLKRRKG